MIKKWEQLIVESYSRDNILHLTSICTQKCVFCSHRFNPPEIEVFSPGHLPLPFIKEMMDFLDPGRTVRTGESVSRVIEGEPFCHPDFFEIIELFRSCYPDTPLEIVTGGDRLDEDKIKRLAELKPLSLKFSLNLVDPILRGRFLSAKKEKIEPVLNSLQIEGIPYSVTAVAIPHLTGWEALDKTINLASRYGPEDITVYRPAFSGKAPGNLIPAPAQDEELEKHLEALSAQIKTPLLLEPARLYDFIPRVVGVREQSPAGKAGLQTGDVIVSVDGVKPWSRVEAHLALNKAGGKRLLIQRAGKEKELFLQNGSNSCSGAIFYRDIDFRIIEEIKETGAREKVGVVTSYGAFPLLQGGLSGSEIELFPVANRGFGGNLNSAGLLGVRDILQQAGKAFVEKELEKIILPGVMFDRRGRDLWGLNITELEERVGIPCLEFSG